MIVSGRSNLEQQQILFRQSGESAPVIMAREGAPVIMVRESAPVIMVRESAPVIMVREGAPVIMAHEVGCVKTLARTGDPTKRNDSWG